MSERVVTQRAGGSPPSLAVDDIAPTQTAPPARFLLAGWSVAVAQALAVVAVVATTATYDPRAWVLGALVVATLCDPGPLRIQLSAAAEAGDTARRVAVAAALAAPVIAMGHYRAYLVAVAAGAAGAASAAKALVYLVIRHLRTTGFLAEATLLAGSDDVLRLAEALERNPELGLVVIGAVDDAGDGAAVDGLDGIAALVEALHVRRVIVGADVLDSPDRVHALRAVQAAGAAIHILPRMGSVLPGAHGPGFDLVQGFALHRMPPEHPTGLAWKAKRGLDVTVAALLLAVSAPLIMLGAVGVKVSSRGPVLFRQQRIGLGGRSFTMFKLRTFPTDHEDVVFSLPHDDCPLWWGRVLRRTSLDELPQLWNVVRGDMSLVGPRPERDHFAEDFIVEVDGYADRHRVRGGLTGLAQVHGRWRTTSIEERVRLDNRYVDDWSLWGDLVILARTPAALLRKARH